MKPPSLAGEKGALLLPSRLRDHAFRVLPRMFDRESGLFQFRIRRADGGGILREGLSVRYTAIVLIGLSGESPEAAKGASDGREPQEIFRRLRDAVSSVENLGDAALILWAGSALGEGTDPVVLKRLESLDPCAPSHPTVEVAWALAALCKCGDSSLESLRYRLARRLVASFSPGAALFPHLLPPGTGGMRSHVSCFADLVYPIEALSYHSHISGEEESLRVAGECARRICDAQGDAGQWWWHYDLRTGRVLEGYPVYAIHQDAMAPMALFALASAGGADHSTSVRKGLGWLLRSPELGGGSLIDDEADIVWRKVARKEPGKFSRYVRTAASRIHPSASLPGWDVLFPPGAIDHEDRPYHLGWLLHAWPAARAAAWEKGAALP